MGLRCFLPVHASGCYGAGFTRRGRRVGQGPGEGDVLEGSPYVQGEWVEDVASPAAEEAWDERHGEFGFGNLEAGRRLLLMADCCVRVSDAETKSRRRFLYREEEKCLVFRGFFYSDIYLVWI